MTKRKLSNNAIMLILFVSIVFFMFTLIATATPLSIIDQTKLVGGSPITVGDTMIIFSLFGSTASIVGLMIIFRRKGK